MKTHQKGIHHISVLAGDPQRNAEFYVKTLGLRLIKKTVNQDDPGTYHLFYGNQEATSGASLTFFPWPKAVKGETGTGEAVTVSFSVPEQSLPFWQDRLHEQNVPTGEPFTRFGLKVLPFEDPDGLHLELVFESIDTSSDTKREGNVPKEHAIRGFWGTTLRLTEAATLEDILTDVLGFKKAEKEGNLQRYTTDAPIGGSVIIETTEVQVGVNGRGTVHHIAFRAADKGMLSDMRRELQMRRYRPTELIDRHWFNSVYFRTLSGILFEMATEGPGYAVDEDPDHLGEKLMLAPWLEPRRKEIENHLPEINI